MFLGRLLRNAERGCERATAAGRERRRSVFNAHTTHYLSTLGWTREEETAAMGAEGRGEGMRVEGLRVHAHVREIPCWGGGAAQGKEK